MKNYLQKYLNTSMYLVFNFFCKKYLVLIFEYIWSINLVFKYKKYSVPSSDIDEILRKISQEKWD